MTPPQDMSLTSASNYPRHKEYYIPTADLHLLVRGTRFRIHSSFLEEASLYWKEQINKRSYGLRESKPLRVDESPKDFARFCWIFYNPRYDVYKTSPKQWVTVLRLATKWDCPDIRKFAISYIKSAELDAMKKIKIFKRYNVPESELLSLYVQLASRKRMLTREEFCVLDEEAKFSVTQAREMLLEAQARSFSESSDVSSSGSVSSGGISREERSQILSDVFGWDESSDED
ncbi:hypothetical protein Agabi119p4_2183 [Agaricus bisporus var. burnettii]|uniref:BTB domain-containing protein n=1 Tax=Agaricus bisporus var. burnettii TaxID=192524 RepID=A0A8H7KJX7_AGABI|nr:hypothetical protein AGABI2DRAFT_192904 [Agaricus bisporus var. bisporus H97]EKV47751.1 hypothetical protein AGABI2DRAFT_192904 [Agaricus bisporus var. bisporus H97]KAF7782807.1 hypothetical protein Agabi119p4_2183 [Agaricus bisporus var. burnettii]